MAGVEQHPHRERLVGQYLDAANIAHFVVIGHRRDRAFVALKYLDHHKGAVGKQRTAPAPRPECADRGQRQQRRVDRQDRTLRREVIGGGAGRGCNQDAVGDQLRHTLALVDQDAQPRGLIGLAKQRDFVDGMVQMHRAVDVGGAHQKRIDQRFPRRGEPRMQIMCREFVHQEADGAAMHAVDRLARAHMGVQRLQHQAVAAERDHDIGVVGIVIAVKSGQLRQRRLRLRACTRNEGDPVISLGAGHRIFRAHIGASCARGPSARSQASSTKGRLYDLGHACRDGSQPCERRHAVAVSADNAIGRRDRRQWYCGTQGVGRHG